MTQEKWDSTDKDLYLLGRCEVIEYTLRNIIEASGILISKEKLSEMRTFISDNAPESMIEGVDSSRKTIFGEELT